MKFLLPMLGLAALALAGCGKKPIVEDTAEIHSGDTRPLLAADLIGMDGQQLKDTADQMKAATEKHNQELQKALENASK
jgi:hypothetical protein